MSDNVTANAGSGGAVFVTEDTGSGVQLPVTKVSYGAHGVNTPVALAQGLPVQPATNATFPVSAAALPLPAGASQDGADGTSITPPTGGSGIRGWLSGIFQKLSGTLATSRTWTLASGSDSVTATISGTVPVSIATMPSTPVTGTFWQSTQPVALASTATVDGSITITTGGTAQTLFSSSVPVNGFAVYNPDPTNDLWISDSTTASANGTGSIRVQANGGWYETPVGSKPIGAVSVYGSVTGQKITARRW